MSVNPFVEEDVVKLGFDTSNKKWIEVTAGSQLYGLVSAHIPSHLLSGDIVSCRPVVCPSKGTGKDTPGERVKSNLGLGLFTFEDHLGNPVTALHQTIGKPVGTNCGPCLFSNLVLFTERSMEDLTIFLSHLVEISEKSSEGMFTCYGWHVQNQFWKHKSTSKARPIGSVILPAKTKEVLLNDVSQFLDEETSSFYEAHGIPYRRSYLFYGVPGTGKTSLIQALAGYTKRSISFLQPTDPKMTDDALKEAITKLPRNTICVFEDIDSLFDVDRANKVKGSCLTFSGLLNALDGVGSSGGQIYVLTTNLKHQLDPALIRSGRVDMHVEFSHILPEQVQEMWNSYYPQAIEYGERFATSLTALIGEKKLSAASLQHYFVRNMRSSAAEALENVHWIVEDMNEKELGLEMDKEKATAEEEKKVEEEKDAKKKKSDEEEKKSEPVQNKKETEAHIHLHIHHDGNNGKSSADTLGLVMPSSPAALKNVVADIVTSIL